MTHYTLSQIRRANVRKQNYDRQFPLSFWVVRPLSCYLSYLLLKFTESPSRVAYAGLVIGLGACLIYLLAFSGSVWLGTALLVLYALVDASDGNIARVTGNVSVYGKFLDGLIGTLVEGGFWLCLAFGIYRHPESFTILYRSGPDAGSVPFIVMLSAVLITWGKLYGTQVMATYYSHRGEFEPAAPAGSEKLQAPVQTSRFEGHFWYRLHLNLGSFDLQLLLLVLALFSRVLDLYFLFYAAYYTVSAGLFTVFYLGRARRTLR